MSFADWCRRALDDPHHAADLVLMVFAFIFLGAISGVIVAWANLRGRK